MRLERRDLNTVIDRAEIYTRLLEIKLPSQRRPPWLIAKQWCSSIAPQSLCQLIGTDDFDGTTPAAVEAAAVSTQYSSLILTRPSWCLLPPVSLAEDKI
jgi:hypothetical protein